MLLETTVILALIVLNGVLAMSELAVVSSRPAKLQARANRGDRGAQAALALAETPGRFRSTVQIGITLVGILSGALSGATLGLRLAAVLPQIWLLDRSGGLILALLGQSGRREATVSDEEIRMLISEAEGAGVIEKAETEMIAGVMRVADRTARGLMTPRHDVEIALAEESRAEIFARFATSGGSRLPLRQGGPDEIIGVLHSRDLLAASDGDFDPAALAQPAPVIHEALPATQVIERLKGAPAHMLLVYDKYGHFEGIITPMDILGAIAGGFDETERDEPKVVERENGSLLVAGWMPVDEFAARIDIKLEDHPTYETVSGLVLDRAGELLQVGQHVIIGDWRIEVVDLDGRRIDKLLVSKTAT